MTKMSDESWKDGCYWAWLGMKDVHCCNPSPDLSPLPPIVQRTQPLRPQMCRTTFGSLISERSAGLHWIRSEDSSLSLAWKHCQPTQRGCVGTHAHSTCDTDQLWASTRFVCVNFTYFSMVIVRNCWNIMGCITCSVDVIDMKTIYMKILVVCSFSVWIPTRWRCRVLHAWFCWVFSPLSSCNCNMIRVNLWMFDWFIVDL